MKIFVTGATGFIGRKLIDEFAKKKDYTIVAFNRRKNRQYSDKSCADNIEWIQGDLLNRAVVGSALVGVNKVVHLAAQLGLWKNKEQDIFETNVTGTKILLEEARKCGVNHFIHISTAGVMGRLRQIPAAEDHPCRPRFAYEKTKYLAEQSISEAIGQGFPATILRPSHVYGPGDLNTLSLIKFIIKTRFFPLINGGKYIFQPIYIDELVAGIIGCIETGSAVSGKTYILAGNESITFKEYIKIITGLLSIHTITIPCPYYIAMLSAVMSESFARLAHLEPALTRFRVEFFGGNQFYNTTRAACDFNYSPQIKIIDGMRAAIDWYKACKLI